MSLRHTREGAIDKLEPVLELPRVPHSIRRHADVQFLRTMSVGTNPVQSLFLRLTIINAYAVHPMRLV